MPIVVKNIPCLSHSGEDGLYAQWKALPGDTIKVFLVNGASYTGVLGKVINGEILLNVNNNIFKLKTKDIKGFDVIYRGDFSKRSFWYSFAR